MKFWKNPHLLFKFNIDWKKTLSKIIMDYVKETSIHGINYLMTKKLIIRIFWMLSIIVSIIGCSLLVTKVYIKWEENPVIVSVNEKSTPIWTIPFPAVTICPEIKFKRSLFNLSDIKFIDENNTLTEQQIMFQNALYPICSFSYPIITKKKIKFAAELKKIAIPFNEIFKTCSWRGVVTKCEELFSEVQTDEGICYTFNMMNYNDLFTDKIDESMKYPKHSKSSAKWSLQDGYNSYDSKTFPERVIASGLKAGIKINLIGNVTDIEYRCSGFFHGFKLALSLPNEVPRFAKQYNIIGFNREAIINVEPQVFITSDVLKSYKPQVRKCYFDGEKTLKYFKSYTKTNCDLECLSNVTKLTCGCVQFGMPFDNNTELCQFNQQACLKNVEMSWFEQKMKHYLKQKRNKQSMNFDTTINDCKCLPSCSSTIYKSRISESNFLRNKDLNDINYIENQESSTIVIHFKDDEFIALKRSEFYGWTDFLSKCGGIFGLFMGISILSVVEFIYYFTLRWIVSKPVKITTAVIMEPIKVNRRQWVSESI